MCMAIRRWQVQRNNNGKTSEGVAVGRVNGIMGMGQGVVVDRDNGVVKAMEEVMVGWGNGNPVTTEEGMVGGDSGLRETGREEVVGRDTGITRMMEEAADEVKDNGIVGAVDGVEAEIGIRARMHEDGDRVV